MFSLSFFSGEPRYIRRARAYLQEARMSMLEHTIAAEHYQASAEMYAERARRLEEEIAHWEAHKTGEEHANAAPAVPAKAVAQGRMDAGKHHRGKHEPPVGIVRAA